VADIDESKLCFHLDGKFTAAGHFFLRLSNKDTKLLAFQEFQHALIEKDGKHYLSSELFMSKNDDMFARGKGLISSNTCYMDRKGPSIPKYVKQEKKLQMAAIKHFLHKDFLVHTIDYVRCFPCSVPCILQAWKSRKRHHNWPSKKTIETVTSLPAFIVPVWEKKTKNKDLQWRICFTLGELCLVKSLNNTHMKVYGALKFISKHILNPNSADCQITSFMVKNIVYWLAEKKPRKMFKPEFLWHRIEDALRFLKKCISAKNLPYYMLPQRNLLKSRVTPHQQQLLTNKIDEFFQNGKCMFHDLLQSIDTGPADSEIMKVCATMLLAYNMSKLQTLSDSLVTVEQLVHNSVSAFHRKSCIMQCVNGLVTFAIPMFYTYGFKVFKEPQLFSPLCQDHEMVKIIKEQEEIEYEKHCPKDNEQHPTNALNKHNGISSPNNRVTQGRKDLRKGKQKSGDQVKQNVKHRKKAMKLNNRTDSSKQQNKYMRITIEEDIIFKTVYVHCKTPDPINQTICKCGIYYCLIEFCILTLTVRGPIIIGLSSV